MRNEMSKNDRKLLSGTHFMLGNHAVVEGALAAGCDFFAGYPITPANEISQYMSERMPKTGGVFFQGEDELCSVYALSGASLAGAKAMTATASAGFNYMQEGIGYAVASEIPMVIVDVMRCRGENYATQSDVMQFRWGASGDHEHIVLAPSSVQELFDYTLRAFNLSEKYRTPVFVMSETTISLMREKLVIPEEGGIEIVNRRKPDVPPEEFVPFRAPEDQAPPLPSFGDGYRILHSLNPHDEKGGIAWDPDVFEKLYHRITNKIRANYDDIVRVQDFDLDNADIALVAYGSESRPARAAARIAKQKGINVGVLKLDTVWPVPERHLEDLAKRVDKILAVEMNIGKYANEIDRVCGKHCEVGRVLKNRGEIHTTTEVLRAIEEATK
jgi:2-oxoglutarate ferredoxin oxidoreductase subunit alpha